MKKILIIFILFLSSIGFSQVTNSSITGNVKSVAGQAIIGASVSVVHQPTGTKYYSITDKFGGFSIPSIRPGGPYVLKVSYTGYKTAQVDEINASLGNNASLKIVLQEEMSTLKEVVITTKKSGIISKSRTGASQQFSTREINSVPVLGSRNISAITKYNANAGKDGSFGGQDARMNNFTIDGSVFNNGFGLGNDTQAGGRTGSTAISLDAIEQLQVNIAPYDVRQSGFTGSGINAVTRSGTNEIEGSVYTTFRENSKYFLGTHAGNVDLTPTPLSEKVWGARIGAPIIKDKLFVFINLEKVDNTSPASTWTSSGPNQGAQAAYPSYAEMQQVSTNLQNNFGYATGPWENYDKIIASKKFLTRLDWNINDNNKFSIRYVFHNSSSDVGISNSYTGNNFQARSGTVNSLSFKNSGYVIQDNTRSIVAELNTKISEKWSNNFIAGYDKQIEDRALQGESFPTIDILNPANPTNVYITAGLDPFTPGNKLDYSNLHFSDNVTKLAGKHTLLFGANFERFVSNNLFFPGSNGNYTFKDLSTFLAASNESASLGGLPGTNSANLPLAFQYRYSALPGGVEPLQVLKSNKFDLYVQDEYKAAENLKLTFGLRASRTSFDNTALENPIITPLTFVNGEKLNTGDMPDAQILFEPRFGFNLDLKNDGKTQIRGGSGVFTGRPPFVFLSNAIGNNGVLTGFSDARTPAQIAQGNGTTLTPGPAFGFTPNPDQYFTPTSASAPASYDLAFTDKNFKFPQVWKTNIAFDQKLPLGFIGTIEGIYSKNINAVNYYNANLDAPTGTFTGVDARPMYAGTDNGVRINNNVQNAIVLTNTDKGYFYSTTFKLEYPYKKGLWGSVAYTYSNATDLMNASSIASSSYGAARSATSNNNLQLSSALNNTPHRVVGVLGYKFEYGKKYGASTSINLGYIGEQSGNQSYSYNGDMNGDRISGNDLIFVPKVATDLKFTDITQTVGGSTLVLYTAAEQQEAFDKFIDQDPYLSTRRGQYAERNGIKLPMLNRLDLSVTQEVFIKIAGKKNSFQFRADILNFGNMLNRNWGVSQRITAPNILIARGNTNIPLGSTTPQIGTSTPQYQMAFQTDADGTRHLATDSFQKQASTFDVWTAQFSIRYTFGK
jgi:Carboxypeptidase regulatory-like domain